MPRLSLHFLGAFDVTVNGQPAASFRSNRARGLLAYLAVETERAHARPALAADFWPDLPEAEALHNLRQTLVRIRQAIGDEQAHPPHLLITRQDVRFNPASDFALDVAEFERPILAGQLTASQAKALEYVVALYQGEFLRGFSLPDSYAFDDWLLLKRERLHQRALDLLNSLAEWHLARGQPQQALVHARRQLELDAWREAAHRQAMLALALDGQRSAALTQYETCRQTLAADLHVAPETETAALYEAIKAGEFDHPRPTPTPGVALHSNLPTPLTPFIGREAEIEHLLRLLRAPAYRLITLAGEGGMGKTRLALALAERLPSEFTDGVCFVPLAEAHPAQAETALVTGIAAALGLTFTGKGTPQMQLLNALRPRQLLLILDNFESLLTPEDETRTHTDQTTNLRLSAPAILLELLQQAPGLKILLTSRQRLHLQAEYLYRLKGLPVPADDDADAARFSSVQLFAERAERTWHEFTLDASTLPQVIAICRLVEGMPLGIELAAAYADQMSVGEIARAIHADLGFLASAQRDLPVRHRSLRAVFEGSWRALSAANQRVLAECSVFVGSFDLPAAAAVAQATPEALRTLLDRSLLRQASPGRYELHALVRQFAAHKLTDPACLPRHAEYFTRFVETRLDDLRGPRQPHALPAIALEIENIRHTWRAADLPRRLRLAEGLERFYELRGWYGEGGQVFAENDGEVSLQIRQAHFEALLGQFEAARARLHACLTQVSAAGDPLWQGRCLYLLGSIASDLGDLSLALDHSRAALTLFEQTGADEWIANAHTNLGRTLAVRGQYAEARAAFQRGLALRRKRAAPADLADSLNNLGLLALRTGDYPAAERYLPEALAYARQMDNQPGAAAILSNLGLVHLERQRYAEARACFREALDIQTRIGDREAIGILQNNLGDVANLLGEYRIAIEHLEASLALKRAMNNRRGQTFSLVHLGHAWFGLGDAQQAWHYHLEALRLANEISLTPLILAALVGLAQVLASAGQTERAVELLHHPLHHPAGWQRVRNEAQALLASIHAQAGAPVCDRSLENVVATLLAEITS